MRPVKQVGFHVVAVSSLFLAAGCTTDVTLVYRPANPHPAVVASAPVIASVTQQDQRREPPRRLGTVMGSFGNPLKILDTNRPVSEEVAAIFRQALQRRRLLREGATAPYVINVVVRRFDTDQIIGLGARSDLLMQVRDGVGRVIYEDSAQTSRSEVRFMQSGVLASMDAMQASAEAVLAEAVDKLLDNPAFLAAVQGGAALR